MELDDLKSAIIKNRSALYGDTAIRIRLIEFDTKKATKCAYRVDVPTKLAGSRLRKQFPTLSDAVDWIEDWLQKRSTTKAKLSEAADFNHCLPRLRENKVTIGELLDFYEERFIASDIRLRISEIQSSLLSVLDGRPKEEQIADHTRRKVVTMGKRIAEDFQDCYIDELTADRGYKWVTTAEASKGKRWSQKTRLHHWAHLNRLVDFAIGENALKSNPLKELPTEKKNSIKPKKKEPVTPEILTLKEAKSILAVTAKHYPKMLPCVIISLFDGVRQHEAWQLKGSDFDFEDGTITIDEKIAKTRSIRFVELSEASKAWLKTCQIPDGNLLPFSIKSAEGRWTTILKKAGVQKHNALRHTAASVMLMLHDETHTKEQLGHTEGSSVLFKHYRKAMKKKDAQEFADLRPLKKASEMENTNIPFPTAV